MRPIFRWTFWQRRWSTFWWSVGIAAFMVLNLAFYPTFREQAAELSKTISSLPPAARSLISDSGNFSSPEDFLSGRVFYLMLPLLLSVMSIIIGSSIISKDEDEGTIEMVLSRPVSRGRYLIAKALTAISILTITGLVALFTTLIIGSLVDIEVSVLNIEVAALMAVILSVLFGAIAFCLTAVGRFARGASAGITAFIALGSYIVVSLSGVVGWLKWPAKILPHHYYRPSEVLYGNYQWQNAVGLLIATLALGIIAWYFFRKRDIGV